jgi:hypothetical protein
VKSFYSPRRIKDETGITQKTNMPLYTSQKLKIYNSLSEKHLSQSTKNRNVCFGPTVYTAMCILETYFMSFDVIFRYLLHLEYKVRYVQILLMGILWMMLKAKIKLQKKHVGAAGTHGSSTTLYYDFHDILRHLIFTKY